MPNQPDLPGPEGLDRPEEDNGYELAVPFVVCQSYGGPYADDAFVAGFQAGRVDQALTCGRAAFATTIEVQGVDAALHKQLELIGMYRGYPVVTTEQVDGFPDYINITFRTTEPIP